MDSLKEWYRYVDQVSRPARRLTGDEPVEPSMPAWRPWMAPADPAEVEESVRPEAVPTLDFSFGRFSVGMQNAEPEYVDETVHDELKPIREFAVPRLDAPQFALDTPRLGVEEPEPRVVEARQAEPAPAPDPLPTVQEPPHHSPEPEAFFAAPRLDLGRSFSPPEFLREVVSTPEPVPAEPALRTENLAAEEAPSPVVESFEAPAKPEEPVAAAPAIEFFMPGEDVPVAIDSNGSRSLDPPEFLREAPPSQRSAPSEQPEPEAPPVGPLQEQLEERSRYGELLSKLGGEEVAQNSYKSPFRESRDELLQRLLDPALTLEETARLLGVCPTTVRRYTNRGMLRHFRTEGNQRRFRLSDVVEFLSTRGEEIAADAARDREAGSA
jgi:excisionase family DNA binding protein